MEFRSTNPNGFGHFGGDIVSGVQSTVGVQLTSNVVQPCGDAAAINLIVRGKGTGSVFLGGSTSGITGLSRGIATLVANNPVLLPASALVYSTITIPGVAVGDALFISRSTGMSTALGMAGSWVTGADEGSFAVINNLASTQSISSGATFPYLYVKA